MARNPRPVAVAKAPKAIPNDEFSSPVFGSAWLPRLCLGSFTSEVDSEALVEADTEADVLALCNSFNDTDSLVEIEVLTEADCDSLNETLNDVEILVEALVLSEALKNADVEADSDTETLDEADSE